LDISYRFLSRERERERERDRDRDRDRDFRRGESDFDRLLSGDLKEEVLISIITIFV
jgi:hypothetical protein